MKTALFLDLHLEIDGKLKLMIKLYNKHNDFPIFNFISLSAVAISLNIPVYEAFISKLIRYATIDETTRTFFQS